MIVTGDSAIESRLSWLLLGCALLLIGSSDELHGLLHIQQITSKVAKTESAVGNAAKNTKMYMRSSSSLDEVKRFGKKYRVQCHSVQVL